jgi:hypothetical protein
MKRRSLLSIFIAFSLCLGGCQPSNKAIQASIFQTQTASSLFTPSPSPTPLTTPTPSETPIPLSEIYLDDILLVTGDFEEGTVVNSTFRHTSNPIIGEVEEYEQLIGKTFAKENGYIGIAAIFLFEDFLSQEQAYKIILQNLEDHYDSHLSSSQKIIGFGEKGQLFHKTIVGNTTVSSVLFVRCQAIIFASKSMEDADSSAIIYYAKRLDDRISHAICPTE